MAEIEIRHSAGINYITDATLIATITDPANWDSDGNYTGSTTALNKGDTYIDMINKIRYEFDGVNLVRNQINEII